MKAYGNNGDDTYGPSDVCRDSKMDTKDIKTRTIEIGDWVRCLYQGKGNSYVSVCFMQLSKFLSPK